MFPVLVSFKGSDLSCTFGSECSWRSNCRVQRRSTHVTIVDSAHALSCLTGSRSATTPSPPRRVTWLLHASHDFASNLHTNSGTSITEHDFTCMHAVERMAWQLGNAAAVSANDSMRDIFRRRDFGIHHALILHVLPSQLLSSRVLSLQASQTQNLLEVLTSLPKMIVWDSPAVMRCMHASLHVTWYHQHNVVVVACTAQALDMHSAGKGVVRHGKTLPAIFDTL